MFNDVGQSEIPRFAGAGCLNATARKGAGAHRKSNAAFTVAPTPRRHLEEVTDARLAAASGAREPGVGDSTKGISTCQTCPSDSLEAGAGAGCSRQPAAPTDSPREGGVAPLAHDEAFRRTQLRGVDTEPPKGCPCCQAGETASTALVTTRSRARAEGLISHPGPGDAEMAAGGEDSATEVVESGADGDSPPPDTRRAQANNPQEGPRARVDAALIMELHRKMGHPTADRLTVALRVMCICRRCPPRTC